MKNVYVVIIVVRGMPLMKNVYVVVIVVLPHRLSLLMASL
jgi:hypothetical protein